MNKKLLLIAAFSLVAAACVSTSLTPLDSNINSYNYDAGMRLTETYEVKALRAEISNDETNEQGAGIKLRYKDSNKEKHQLQISPDYIVAFKSLLIEKSKVSKSDIDKVTNIQISQYHQVDVVTNFVKDTRIISIGSFNGIFAFQDDDVIEILRLLDESQSLNNN